MTLTELLVSISVLGLLTTVVAAAIAVVFRSESGIETAIAESHDVQQAVNYFHFDVQSGPVLLTDYVTAGPTGAGCSDAGATNLFRFDDGDRRIAYELSTTGAVAELDRVECRWNGGAWDQVSRVNLADQLDAGSGSPAAVTVEADPTESAEVARVVMTLSQTTGDRDVIASPRAETGLAAGPAPLSCTDDPLEPMLGFGSFVYGDATLNSGSLEGSLAVGGTLDWNGTRPIATNDTNNTNGFSSLGLYATALDWGGSTGDVLRQPGGVKAMMLGSPFHVVNGTPKRVYATSAQTGARLETHRNGSVGPTSANPVDFDLRFAELEDCAEQMAKLPNSCTSCAEHVTMLDALGTGPYPGAGSVTLDFGSNITQVLNLPESELADITELRRQGGSSLNASRALVVNIDDDDDDGDVYFDFTSTDWQNVGDSKFVIFNFPNATGTVTIVQDVYGVVFAPYAEVVTNGEVHAAVVARSWVHDGGTVQNDQSKIFNATIGWD